MNGIAELTAINRLILDLIWFIPLACIGLPLFIYCVIQLAYWLCFSRRKPVVTHFDSVSLKDTRIYQYREAGNSPPPATSEPTEKLKIRFCIGPCLSSSDIAEIEAEQVKEEGDEAWSL